MYRIATCSLQWYDGKKFDSCCEAVRFARELMKKHPYAIVDVVRYRDKLTFRKVWSCDSSPAGTTWLL